MPVVPVTTGEPITEAWGDSVAAAVTDLESFAATHPGAADPHTGYRLESADHSHASAGLQGGTIAHSALTGLTAGDPHTQYQQESERGAASGYAPLDSSSKVPAANLPTPGSGMVQTLNFVIDGAGTAIATGIKGDVRLDFAGTITQWTALADQTGSITVNVWKAAYSAHPPVAGGLLGSPAISAANKAQSGAISWAFVAGDELRFNVASAATIQRVTIALTITRT